MSYIGHLQMMEYKWLHWGPWVDELWRRWFPVVPGAPSPDQFGVEAENGAVGHVPILFDTAFATFTRAKVVTEQGVGYLLPAMNMAGFRVYSHSPSPVYFPAPPAHFLVSYKIHLEVAGIEWAAAQVFNGPQDLYFCYLRGGLWQTFSFLWRTAPVPGSDLGLLVSFRLAEGIPQWWAFISITSYEGLSAPRYPLYGWDGPVTTPTDPTLPDGVYTNYRKRFEAVPPTLSVAGGDTGWWD